MINIEAVVWAVLWLLGAAAIFGLLFYAVTYCEGKFPKAGPIFNFIKIFLVVAACFLLIFMILAFMAGKPLFRWGA